MSQAHTVLVLGGTGRTGRLVVQQLLDRGVAVRAIVRSADRLPVGAAQAPGTTVVEADLLTLSDQELLHQLRGCDAVISCLGHTVSLKGVFGAPRDLVTRAVADVCRAAEALEPSEPIKVVVMSSVSVNHPETGDARRGVLEKAVLRLLRWVMPPANDNQRAADFLCGRGGMAGPCVQWVAIRPDTLEEGEVCDYALHESLVSSLFRPDHTNRANIAHFMCELVTDPGVWNRWRSGLPVIVNVAAPGSDATAAGG